MPAADREDKTSVISVAIEFLETDASLPTFLAFSEEQRVSDDGHDRVVAGDVQELVWGSAAPGAEVLSGVLGKSPGFLRVGC